MNNDNLIKKADIQKIAEAGAKIYETIKLGYEPAKNGKFLAIDIGSKDVSVGNTSSEAVEKARKAHPNKVFYVVKIGSSAPLRNDPENMTVYSDDFVFGDCNGAVRLDPRTFHPVRLVVAVTREDVQRINEARNAGKGEDFQIPAPHVNDEANRVLREIFELGISRLPRKCPFFNPP